MTERERTPSSVVPGLLLVAVDAVVGWHLYEITAPWLGVALWVVAALLVGGMLVDGIREIPRPISFRPRSAGGSLDASARK